MKAIETYYKNTRFRSRLEAKWALFFDELGIIWDYECEGFESRGICYLPDFYLPELGYFFEVKPYAPSKEDFQKSAIGVECSGKTVIFAWGYPITCSCYEDNFLMAAAGDFYVNGEAVDELPKEYINFPSLSDRFGIVGIDITAAETLLGDYDGIRLARKQFSVGGLETAIFEPCVCCGKYYFNSPQNTGFATSYVFKYDDFLLCPFRCKRKVSRDAIHYAALKARNHRFGRIA